MTSVVLFKAEGLIRSFPFGSAFHFALLQPTLRINEQQAAKGQLLLCRREYSQSGLVVQISRRALELEIQMDELAVDLGPVGGCIHLI